MWNISTLSFFVIYFIGNCFLILNGQTPLNDQLCDVSTNPDFHLAPGVADSSGSNATLIAGTTENAGPFVDSTGNQEYFGCDTANAAVFYKVLPDNNASSISIFPSSPDSSTISIALFRVNSACDSVNYEVLGNTLEIEAAICSLDSTGFHYSLCHFDSAELSNLYLWVATSDSATTDFQLELSQTLPPTNAYCSGADLPGDTIATGSGWQCFPSSNLYGCPFLFEDISFDPDFDTNCSIESSQPNLAGSWYQFTTDSSGYRGDFFVEHDTAEVLYFSLYEAQPDCSDFLALHCESSTGSGLIQAFNQALSPNATYYLYVGSPIEQAGDFELCIQVQDQDSLACEKGAVFYNQTTPICAAEDIIGSCISLGPPNAGEGEPWPGCRSCCAFHNPSWMTFVAPTDDMSMTIEVSNCATQSGVQLSVYELQEDIDYNPESTEELVPSRQQLITDCSSYVVDGLIGTVTFDIPTEQGKLYGMVTDGWRYDSCDVRISDADLGDYHPMPPDTLEQPEIVPPASNTYCQIEEFTLSLQKNIEGANYYTWDVNGEEIASATDSSIQFSNLVPGSNEICVTANTPCRESNTACVELEIEENVQINLTDTFCQGNSYAIHDTSFTQGGSYEFFLNNAQGCDTSVSLNLIRVDSIQLTSYTVGYDEDEEAGQIQLINIEGGTGNYFYEWSNGATSRNITGLDTGTYSVTITDAAGCEASYSFNVISTSAFSPFSQLAVLFPNPVSSRGQVQIKGERMTAIAEQSLRWVNGLGQERTAEVLHRNNATLELRAPQQAGVYVLIGRNRSGEKFTSGQLVVID